MILYDLSESEDNPIYQKLATSNGDRQYSFLHAIVSAALEAQQPFLSQAIIKSLNFHAITCLHTSAGEYRPCPVYVRNPARQQHYEPPQHFRVAALMDNFTNVVNRQFDTANYIELAAFVLWRLCWIHPFINGNGRTARAACYYVICLKVGGWLPGQNILPTLLKSHPEYAPALITADESHKNGNLNLNDLCLVIAECLNEQLGQVAPLPGS